MYVSEMLSLKFIIVSHKTQLQNKFATIKQKIQINQRTLDATYLTYTKYLKINISAIKKELAQI